jgi:hypothetical protein
VSISFMASFMGAYIGFQPICACRRRNCTALRSHGAASRPRVLHVLPGHASRGDLNPGHRHDTQLTVQIVNFLQPMWRIIASEIRQKCHFPSPATAAPCGRTDTRTWAQSQLGRGRAASIFFACSNDFFERRPTR